MSKIKSTPWDSATFGLSTYELVEYSAVALQESVRTPGHHTVKVDPLSDKRLLHEYGYYYCDTLIEPFCHHDRLRAQVNSYASVSVDFDRNRIIGICQGAFVFGRFHRDFNLPAVDADMRYNKWLDQMIDEKMVYGLYWQNDLAGFIGYRDNSLVLHALAEDYRGKGYSKYWWSEVCLNLFDKGYEFVKSSISSTNLAVLNLYVSLGFSFKNPQDVYHRIVP